MNDIIERMKTETDNYPWYWYSYGEKCYGFAVVSAIPADSKFDRLAKEESGTKLKQIPGSDKWFTDSGIEMCIVDGIAQIENQQGDIICQFIAEAYAELIARKVERNRKAGTGVARIFPTNSKGE